MQNELEGLYNMLVSQTDIMKNVDELVEKQICLLYTSPSPRDA